MRITVMAMETIMLFPTIVQFFIFYHKCVSGSVM